MINLEKINRKSVSPLLLRGIAPALYFHPLLLIFQIPPSGGGNQNLLSLVLKKSGPNYVIYNLYKKNQPQT